jgi:hypothetical protein
MPDIHVACGLSSMDISHEFRRGSQPQLDANLISLLIGLLISSASGEVRVVHWQFHHSVASSPAAFQTASHYVVAPDFSSMQARG